MELLQVAVTAAVSLVAMFLLTKLMGYKQVSQMNLFDYTVGITIGSIAAEMATELEEPLQPLLAMTVYALLSVGISLLTNRSLRARALLSGKPLVLMDEGVIYRENLKRAKMDLGDFLMFCRVGGFFDLGQIQTAVLEHNGSVSFLPAAMQRPATPADFSIQPKQELLQRPLILDGQLLPENLRRMGRDETWLLRQLHGKGYHAPEELLLALYDGSQLRLYPMSPKKEARSLEDQ